LPVDLPDDIRRAVLFQSTNLPALPPGYPSQIHRLGGVAVQTSEVLPMAIVLVEHVADPDQTLTDARAIVRERGQTKAVWIVPEDAEPAGLAQRLLGLGLTAHDRPPFEPRGASWS
jgi:hypothetical protein